MFHWKIVNVILTLEIELIEMALKKHQTHAEWNTTFKWLPDHDSNIFYRQVADRRTPRLTAKFGPQAVARPPLT